MLRARGVRELYVFLPSSGASLIAVRAAGL